MSKENDGGSETADESQVSESEKCYSPDDFVITWGPVINADRITIGYAFDPFFDVAFDEEE